MNTERMRALTRIAVALAVICSLAAGFFAYRFNRGEAVLIETAKAVSRAEAERASAHIDGKLKNVRKVADALAEGLSSGQIKKSDIPARLEAEAKRNPELFGVVAAFAPQAFRSDRRLYAPSYMRKDGRWQALQIEDIYDYTQPEYLWYGGPMKNGAGWLEPYFGKVAGTMIAVYSAPFSLDGGKTKSGVVAAFYSLDDIKAMVNDMEMGRTGYAALISPKGKLISHPIEELVAGGHSVSDLDKDGSSRQAMESFISAAGRGGRGVFADQKAFAGQPAWITYEPIAEAGWSVAVVTIRGEVLRETSAPRRSSIMFIFFAVLALLWLTAAVFLWRYRGDNGIFVNLGVVASVLFMLGTGSIWYVTIDDYPQGDISNVRVVDNTGLKAVVRDVERQSRDRSAPAPVFIPTGIFIQSVDMGGGGEVSLTGYVWQKYMPAIHNGISRGVIFPEASDAEFTDAYTKTEGGVEVVGWRFKATMRELFDYKKYPFDKERIRIRFWHRDFDKNIVLVPDLKAYRFLAPTALPGIQEGYTLSAWLLSESYFSFMSHSYATNFGIDSYVGQKDFPELYFNLELSRKILNPFISKLVPITIVYIMLFSILILSSKREEEIGILGFSAMNVVMAVSALFFVVIFDHISLRESLGAPGVVYIEYFYFILYLAILMVTVNSVLFVSRVDVPLIDYENSLLTKAFFWPFIGGAIFIITILVFY